MKECVIFDLDGTLADVSHRRHHVRKQPPDWAAFFDACGEDAQIQFTLRLLEMVHWYGKSFSTDISEVLPAVFICSGRPDTHRDETEQWLTDALGSTVFSHVTLLMRHAGDHRPDHVVKKEMLDGIRGQGYEPLFAVDDRPSVVKMWRENRVPCLAMDDAEWSGESNVANGPALAGKTLLTLMVGPSGAGKTTWAWREVPRSWLLSSDDFRADLCGDPTDQTRNAEVFAALHDAARSRLRHGLPVVIDATHIRRKDRMRAAALAPIGTLVRYVVLDRPLEDKLRGRPEHVHDVVRKHDQTFRAQLQDILSGDGLPNVHVKDLRQ